MRILQINKFFYLRGGAERHYFDVCDLLEKNGDEVIHFSMDDKRNRPSPYEKYFVSNVQFDNFNVRSLLKAGRIIYSTEARKKLTQLIADTKPDIAHIHLMYHQLSPSILLALRDAKIPVVLTVHDWQMLCPNYSLYTPNGPCTPCQKGSYAHVFTRRLIKNSFAMSGLAALAGYIHHKKRWYEDLVAKYIVPSRFGTALFTSYGWRDTKTVYLPHFSSFPLAESQSAIKKPYLLYAGRLSWEKGIDRLVETWGKTKLPFTLKIAGSGSLENRVLKLIQAYNLSERVELLGFVEPENLRALMREAAGVVAPSIVYETFGLTLYEAWSQGTGVIASDGGALPELCAASGGGKVFSWKKDNAAAVVRSYMNNQAEWRTLGLAGKKYVAENGSPENYYQKLTNVYESVL